MEFNTSKEEDISLSYDGGWHKSSRVQDISSTRRPRKAKETETNV